MYEMCTTNVSYVGGGVNLIFFHTLHIGTNTFMQLLHTLKIQTFCIHYSLDYPINPFIIPIIESSLPYRQISLTLGMLLLYCT